MRKILAIGILLLVSAVATVTGLNYLVGYRCVNILPSEYFGSYCTGRLLPTGNTKYSVDDHNNQVLVMEYECDTCHRKIFHN